MQRAWSAAILATLTLCGCSKLDSLTGTTTTSSTIAPWVTDPQAELWGPLIAVCAEANDDALADAETLLPLTDSAGTSVAQTDLARFYRHRSAQLDALAATFSLMTPPAAVAAEWTSALAGLTTYADWADSVADQVQRKGIKVDQTPPPGLEEFRTLMPYGACSDLLDVN